MIQRVTEQGYMTGRVERNYLDTTCRRSTGQRDKSTQRQNREWDSKNLAKERIRDREKIERKMQVRM